MQIGDYYDLEQIENTILSKKEVNGNSDQYFHKEDIKFKVLDIKKNGDIVLISEKPTEQEITFEGQAGYDNYVEELDRLAKEIIGLKNARAIREEDMIESKYWEDETKKNLIWGEDRDFIYWLASRCVNVEFDYADFNLCNVDSGYFDSRGLCNSLGNASSSSSPFRIIIEIKGISDK